MKIIRFFLLPFLILLPDVLDVNKEFIRIFSIPVENTESFSGVGPPNSELISLLLSNALNLFIWLILNAFVIVKIAKAIRNLKVENIIYWLSSFLFIIYAITIYNYSAQNMYYFHVTFIASLLLLIQFYLFKINGK